jgi:hypothetical protein
LKPADMEKKLMELLNKWHLEYRRALQLSRNPLLTEGEQAEHRIRAKVLSSCSRRLKRAVK